MDNLTYRSLALEIARQEVGVREVGPNNHGERVEEYQTYDSLPGEGYAWCASFINFCFVKAGRPLTELQCSAGVELMLSLARRNGWVVSHPQPGDLVVYIFSHIGIVDVVKSSALITIEGNTGASGAVSDSKFGGDGVYRKERSKQLVRAYIRVPGQFIRVNGKRWPEPVLRSRKGYWAWLAWSLGIGDWKGYPARAGYARPNVPRRIPVSWWLRRRKFVRNRKKGAK